jgi:hypothetical protein
MFLTCLPPEEQVSHAVERGALLELLRSWGPAASAAAPELAALLRANQSVGAVARTLTAIGSPAATEASDLVPLLRTASAGGNGPNELAAAHAAWRLGRDPQPAIDTAIRHIEVGQWMAGAVDLLAEIGEPARRQLPHLRSALARAPGGSEPAQTGHLALARLVWRWTGDASTALPAALAVMRNGWPQSRVDAAILAHELGEPAAIDTLRALLAADPPPRGIALVRATSALWQNGGEVVVEPLLAALADRPSYRVLFAALDLLAEIGPAARSALPLLRRLADQDATIGYYTADDDVGSLDERARALIRALD